MTGLAWAACRLKKKALQQAYDQAIKRKMVSEGGREGRGSEEGGGAVYGC